MRRSAAIFLLSLAALSPSAAHDTDPADGPRLLVNVWVRNSGIADVWTIRPASIDEGSAKAALHRSLGCNFDEAGGDSSEDGVELWAECAHPFSRSGMLVQGEVDLSQLQQLASSAGVPLQFTLGHSRTAYTETAEAMGDIHPDWGHGYYNADFSKSEPPQSVALAFGYRQTDSVWAGAAVILTVFGPLPIVVWLRRRALRRLEAHDDRAFFGFVMPLNFILLFNWAVWWAAVSLWEISYLPMFALDQPYYGDLVWDFVRNAGWVWAPAIGLVVAAGASAEAAAKLARKSWTRSELTKIAAGSTAAILVPTLMIFTGLNAAGSGNLPAAAALIVGSGVALLFGMTLLQRYQGFTPIAVSSGELRDRVFELAKRADVDLRQLFVVPDGRLGSANAFAVGSRVVMLSAALVRGLTRAELDAVVGHELTHLRHKHSWIQIPLVVVPLAFLSVAIEIMAPHAIPAWSYGFIITGVVTVGLGAVSRAHERTAGAGGVEISGDAEAFITGMVKLARLNALPIDWGRTADATLTHPSMRRRIDSAAKAGGITKERLSELISNPPTDGDGYEIPDVAAVENEKVFSQQARNMAAMRKTMTGLCAIVLLPATFVTIDHELGLTGLASGLWLAASAALTAFGILLLDRWEAPLGTQELANQLRAKFGGQGLESEQALVVGLGPHDEPRVYDNSQIWDAGCLFLSQDQLAYVGEETRFTLRRDEIDSLELRPYRPRLAPEAMAVIRWSDRESSRSGAFYLQRFEPRPGREKFQAENQLSRRLRAWNEGVSNDPPSAACAGLSLPDLPRVSSDPCSKIINAKTVTWSMAFAAGLGVAAATVLGFSFDAMFGPAGHGWNLMILSVATMSAAVWNERPVGT